MFGVDTSYPAFPVLSFASATLVLVPLPWHLHAWNAGTCLYMAWAAIANLNLAVNSIIWHNSMINFAPVWCDISSRIIIAAAVGFPASALCIVRRLHRLATMNTVTITKSEKRRHALIDVAIGLGLPLLQLPLQYVVSGHRFDIYEDLGCFPFTYNTPLAQPLVNLWPLVIGLISAVYGCLTLYAFLQRRARFNELLSSNGVTYDKYFRLMVLACMEIIFTVPISIYGTYLDLQPDNLSPWISWADTHAHWSRVDQIPSFLWRGNPDSRAGIELFRWSTVFTGLTFFLLFGFTSDARKHYSQAYRWVVERFGAKRPSPKSMTGQSNVHGFSRPPVGSRDTLPAYTAGGFNRGARKDSLDSILNGSYGKKQANRSSLFTTTLYSTTAEDDIVKDEPYTPSTAQTPTTAYSHGSSSSYDVIEIDVTAAGPDMRPQSILNLAPWMIHGRPQSMPMPNSRSPTPVGIAV